jgi:hypothetical protein
MGAGPFGGDGAEGLQGGSERLGVFVSGVLDSEIIDNQTEEDRTDSMGEETGRMLCGHVAEFGEVLDEAIVSEIACVLREDYAHPRGFQRGHGHRERGMRAGIAACYRRELP